MDLLPDIFNTAIVPETVNDFWKEEGLPTDNLPPRDVLVITRPLGNEGKDQSQLLKMLQACKLEEAQYNRVELPDASLLAWHRIKDQLKPRYVILIGVDPQQLGLSVVFMPHQVSRFDNTVWVYTWSIPQLEQYPEAKKHLWQYGLKPVFVDRSFG